MMQTKRVQRSANCRHIWNNSVDFNIDSLSEPRIEAFYELFTATKVLP